jgi:hypothetical protein
VAAVLSHSNTEEEVGGLTVRSEWRSECLTVPYDFIRQRTQRVAQRA